MLSNAENTSFNEYRVDYLELSSYNERFKYDLKHQYIDINIYESMFTSSMHVDMKIEDVNNLLGRVPIVGQETLVLRLQTLSNDEEQDWLMLSCKLYSISNITQVNETLQYTLQFVTTDFTVNFEEKISKHVKGSGSSIASDMFDAIDSDKDLEIENSKDVQDLVIPNMTVFRCINWLTTRSYNDNGSSYVFFENNKKYIFKTIESLFEHDPAATYKAAGKNVRSYTKEGQSSENKVLISYTVVSKFDVIDNIIKGMYTSSVISCDVVHRKVKKTTHSWYKDSEKYNVKNRSYNDMGGGEVYPLISKNPASMVKYKPDIISYVPYNKLNSYNISDNLLKHN